MLYVSLRDGSVRSLDLGDRADLLAWTELSATPEARSRLTGVALAAGGVRADLPLPRRFREVRLAAELLRNRSGEPVAERVSADADGIVLSLTMSLNGRSGRVRVDLDKRGRRRWVPS